MKKGFFFIASLLLFASELYSQVVLPLYKDSIPNSIGSTSVEDAPTITVYLPREEKRNGTAVIIFPGGAYQFLATPTEGTPVAEAFAQEGITAFVVKYRLPDDATMRDKSLGPLQDAQQAMLTVRKRAREWHLDSNRIGIIGYSAGGHVASTLGTHFVNSYIPNEKKINLRPDFMILVYPVISMESSLTHEGSRINLLGNDPSMEKVLFFSNEKRVDIDTPPTYLTHTGDDRVVDVENSIAFYQALQRSGVHAELHLYPTGNHGFTQRLPVEDWLNPMLGFLKREDFL